MAADPPHPLRDGRLVALADVGEADAAEIPRLLEVAADPRGEAFARAHERPGAGAAIAARALDDGALVGYAAWLADSGADAAFFCAVDPALGGLGLGTLLVRRAAAKASDSGVRALHVALDPRARALAAMLRDCGLRSRWDLEHPVARVEVLLGAPRPGWTTP